LQLDLHITEKKSATGSSDLIPSWYSIQELLSTIVELDLMSQKKCPPLFCKSIQDEQSFLTRYLTDHSSGVQQAMHEKRAQLDAYVTSFHDEHRLKETLQKHRAIEIPAPNETHEQRQIYDYTNKFWPLKKRATFPIDEIFSSEQNISIVFSH
jgi:hypothetical protein